MTADTQRPAWATPALVQLAAAEEADGKAPLSAEVTDFVGPS